MYGNPNREEIKESVREKARAKKGIRFTCAWNLNWNWCEESVDQRLTGRWRRLRRRMPSSLLLRSS